MANTIKTPNPQNKKLVPLLNDWESFRPQSIQTKALPQLLAEYFSSLLVLSTHFKFKPVPAKDYFLYLKQEEWHLSMIEPQRWSQQRRGIYLGRCQLQLDMTWAIEVTEELDQQPLLIAALQQFKQRLTENLDNDRPLKQQLPFYVASLPFYARLAATGLAKSLSSSLGTLGLLERPSRKWLQALEK